MEIKTYSVGVLSQLIPYFYCKGSWLVFTNRLIKWYLNKHSSLIILLLIQFQPIHSKSRQISLNFQEIHRPNGQTKTPSTKKVIFHKSHAHYIHWSDHQLLASLFKNYKVSFLSVIHAYIAIKIPRKRRQKKRRKYIFFFPFEWVFLFHLVAFISSDLWTNAILTVLQIQMKEKRPWIHNSVIGIMLFWFVRSRWKKKTKIFSFSCFFFFFSLKYPKLAKMHQNRVGQYGHKVSRNNFENKKK